MPDYLEIRASSLPAYTDCPRQAAARFMRREVEAAGHELPPGKSSAAAAIGTAVHSMMSELFKQKLQFGEMDFNDAIRVRSEVLESEIGQGVVWDATTPHVETAKKQLAALCKAFLPIAELTNPIDYETKREAMVSPLGAQAIPIKLTGTRDVMDTMREIHDHKTGTKFPACFAQLGTYALLAELNDEPVAAVRVNFAPRLGVTKLDQIQARSIRFPLDECRESAWAVLKEIQRHYEAWLETRDPWAFPANPYSMRCTEKYCTAWGTSWCKVGTNGSD